MPGGPGTQQRAAQQFIIFENFEKMNTASSREGLPENQVAWQENLQSIAPNKLVVVPGVASSPLATLIANAFAMFYADLGGVDYLIIFTTDGAGFAVRISNGIVNNFAPPGTFQNPDVTTWQQSRVLIYDPVSGYSTFDGSLFVRTGNVSPNIQVTNGGSGYSSAPSVTISGGSGTGATAHAVVVAGTVVAVILDNPGTGYQPGDVLTVTFGTGAGTGATGHVTMTGFNVSNILINDGGNFGTPAVGTSALSISGGGGSGAAANATITAIPQGGNQVSSITITNQGSGYTTPPTVTLATTGGRAPSFTAVLGTEAVATIVLDTGGSGYAVPPNVTISGGSPAVAATAHATVGAGAVTSLVLDTAGSGYLATPTVIIGAGAGAAATARVWPFLPTGTTLAVFQGRVWLGSGSQLIWSGLFGFDDFDPANAAGELNINDSDLVHAIEALRAQNNYLLIYGDQSVKQIGNITVSGSNITLFTILTLSSDQGTTFPQSCVSYNRTSMFLNKNGVYAVFGSSVQKLSEDLDGLFSGIDFSQAPQAILLDLFGVHMIGFLVRFADPFTVTTRSLILTFNGKRWFIIVQGESLKTFASAPGLPARIPYGSSGTDVTQLLAEIQTAAPFRLQTALSPRGNSIQRKKVLRSGYAVRLTSGSGTLSMRVETENGSQLYTKTVNAGFQSRGFSADGSGIFLGQTFTGSIAGFSFLMSAIEFQETTLWGDK